jgi:hypothetical protein
MIINSKKSSPLPFAIGESGENRKPKWKRFHQLTLGDNLAEYERGAEAITIQEA